MNAKKKQPELITNHLKPHWIWLLVLGIFFVLLGCIGLGMLVTLTLVSMFFFGMLLIFAGFSQLISLFKYKRWKAIVWHAVSAVLYITGGGLVIYDPLLASTLITALLATTLIIIGISRLTMAFLCKHSEGWSWLLIAGFTAVILGILILMQWPLSGLWIIGLFIAIQLIVDGWSSIFLALAMRRIPS